MMTTGSIFEQIIDPASRADPWPLYRELRKTPVTREADGTHVVSRYREIAALIHDPRVSATGGVALPGRLVNLDPPAHDRIRRSLMRHYGPPEAPGRIQKMRAGLQDVVTALLDRLAGQNRADLVDEFAAALPVTAICRLLGVPVADEPRFRAWFDAIIANIRLQGTAAEDARRKRDDAFAEMDQYVGALADARRDAPGEDLLSALVTDDRTGAEVSRGELTANVALLLFAGHETTTDLIANGILTLLRHPGALKRLGSEPGFTVLVVEEVLRYEPVVHFLPNRLAIDDIDIAGVTIPAGAPIRMALAAANRDPDYVRDPDQFDPDRHSPERAGLRPPESPHLSFGGGIHYCFGAPLARLETEIALTELARRLENPRLLADPPPYRPNPLLHGPEHLPVEFDRIRPARESGIPRRQVALPASRA
jgi:cytochrome P450